MKPYVDISGQKFGKLTVIKFQKRDKGFIFWECVCDCGKLTIGAYHDLIRKQKRSCGCLRLDKQFISIENKAYSQHLVDCKKRNIKSYLTKAAYLDFARRPCTYCNEFSIRKNYWTKATLKLNSVDRINNDPWYVLSGCQSVCFICQQMKNTLRHYDFLAHIKKIKHGKPGNI